MITARRPTNEAPILKIYCPDKLQAYQDKIDDLKTDSTLDLQ